MKSYTTHFVNEEFLDFLSFIGEEIYELRTRIKYLYPERNSNVENIYVCRIVSDKIIGILHYVIPKDPIFSDQLHYISFLSVDPDFRNQGHGKEIVRHWSEKVLRRDLGQCGCSGFTELGYNYFRPMLISLVDKGFDIEIRNGTEY